MKYICIVFFVFFYRISFSQVNKNYLDTLFKKGVYLENRNFLIDWGLKTDDLLDSSIFRIRKKGRRFLLEADSVVLFEKVLGILKIIKQKRIDRSFKNMSFIGYSNTANTVMSHISTYFLKPPKVSTKRKTTTYTWAYKINKIIYLRIDNKTKAFVIFIHNN
jgi:hypothetical protein